MEGRCVIVNKKPKLIRLGEGGSVSCGVGKRLNSRIFFLLPHAIDLSLAATYLIHPNSDRIQAFSLVLVFPAPTRTKPPSVVVVGCVYHPLCCCGGGGLVAARYSRSFGVLEARNLGIGNLGFSGLSCNCDSWSIWGFSVSQISGN